MYRRIIYIVVLGCLALVAVVLYRGQLMSVTTKEPVGLRQLANVTDAERKSVEKAVSEFWSTLDGNNSQKEELQTLNNDGTAASLTPSQPPKPTTESQSVKVTSSKNVYLISLGDYEYYDNAVYISEKYSKEGLSAKVIKSSANSYYVIINKPMSSKSEATAYQQTLKQKALDSEIIFGQLDQ